MLAVCFLHCPIFLAQVSTRRARFLYSYQHAPWWTRVLTSFPVLQALGAALVGAASVPEARLRAHGAQTDPRAKIHACAVSSHFDDPGIRDVSVSGVHFRWPYLFPYTGCGGGFLPLGFRCSVAPLVIRRTFHSVVCFGFPFQACFAGFGNGFKSDMWRAFRSLRK